MFKTLHFLYACFCVWCQSQVVTITYGLRPGPPWFCCFVQKFLLISKMSYNNNNNNNNNKKKQTYSVFASLTGFSRLPNQTEYVQLGSVLAIFFDGWSVGCLWGHRPELDSVAQLPMTIGRCTRWVTIQLQLSLEVSDLQNNGSLWWEESARIKIIITLKKILKLKTYAVYKDMKKKYFNMPTSNLRFFGMLINISFSTQCTTVDGPRPEACSGKGSKLAFIHDFMDRIFS